MPHLDRTAIVALITAKQGLIQGDLAAPHDYQSLKTSIMNEELVEELRFLTMTFSGDDVEARLEDIKAQFKSRCRERAARNINTCLSFTEMPNSAANELYWDIAMHLFHPTTMGEMLSILMPTVTDVITHTATVGEASPLPKDVELGFKREAVATLNGAPSLEALANFVIVGTNVLDVSDIARFDFKLHQRYYRALEKAHPEISARLYQHNPALRTLKTKLFLLEGQGQVPMEVMTTLIRELRLGGTHMTGSIHAAASAQQAFAAFLGYLEALPLETRTMLLALTNPIGKSVAAVIEDLRRGHCVETAAQELQTIIEQPAARTFLNKHPSLSSDYLQALVKDYRAHTLPTKALDSSTSLPRAFLERALSEIHIDSLYDYISLLLSFPPTLYKQLLQHARIDITPLLPPELGLRINEGVLSEEQKQAFFEAIEANQSRFSTNRCLYFYVRFGYTNRVVPLLRALSPDARLAALKRNDNAGHTLLHWAANNPDTLRAMLALYPDDHARLEALKEKDNTGNTLLHWTFNHPDALRAILESLSNDHARLEALKEKNNHGDTVLHCAANYPDTLRAILESLSNDHARLEALKEKNNHGDTVLHCAANYPDALRAILESLSNDHACLEALKEKNNHGDTVLHCAFNHPDALRAILESLSNDHACLEALKEKNNHGDTVLHCAANHPDALRAILESLSNDHACLEALKEKNNHGDTVLHCAANHPDALRAILESLSNDHARLEALKEKNNHGDTVLHCAANYPDALRAILQSLSNDHACLEALKEKNNHGDTVLHCALKHPDALRAILQSLSNDHARLEALKEKNNHGDTVLHCAFNHPDALRVILESLSNDHACLEALKEKNNHGDTVLHCAANYPDTLRAILESLSNDHARLEALKEKNNHGDTVLHCAANYPDTLRAILQSLSNDHARLEALKEKNNHGDTVLHCAANYPDALRAILESLSNDHARLEALKEKNSAGNTVLHCAFNHPVSLRAILQSLSNDHVRVEALEEKNNAGHTVFHHDRRAMLVLYPAMLALYPNDHARLAALKEKDEHGDTLLHCAANNPASLYAMLEQLPPSMRHATVHVKDSRGNTVLKKAAMSSALSQDILVLCANTTGRTIPPLVTTPPKAELSGLIDRIAVCQVSTNDTVLQTYVTQAKTRIENVTPEDINTLKTEFNTILASVSSPEVLAVRHEIRILRGGVTCTSIGKNRKANRIEDALCTLPLELRGTVISGAHNNVQDEIARRRFLGIVDNHSNRLARVKRDTPTEPSNRSRSEGVREGVKFIY